MYMAPLYARTMQDRADDELALFLTLRAALPEGFYLDRLQLCDSLKLKIDCETVRP